MSGYNAKNVPNVGGLRRMANTFKNQIDNLQDSTTLKAVSFVNNTLKFFNTTDTSTTAAYSFDLPAEQFLDATTTAFVPNFTFNSSTYVGATNPNLDGKPVLTLGVKTKNNNETTTTISYSFLDMSTLADTYEASDTSVGIADYKIKVKVSVVANNALTLKSDGLHVDVSDKVDKVESATAGHLATFLSNGNLSDTGIAFATDAEIDAMLDEVFPTVSGGGA